MRGFRWIIWSQSVCSNTRWCCCLLLYLCSYLLKDAAGNVEGKMCVSHRPALSLSLCAVLCWNVVSLFETHTGDGSSSLVSVGNLINKWHKIKMQPDSAFSCIYMNICLDKRFEHVHVSQHESSQRLCSVWVCRV